MRLRANCRRDYRAAHDSGTIPGRPIDWVVLHSAEAPSALAVARWFADPRSGGSTQLCVDADFCFRTLPDDAIPWAAPNANTRGVHIEQAGYARWTRRTWRRNGRIIRRAAFKTAQTCKRHRIPVRFIDADGLASGRCGITTHAEVSKWSATAGLPGDHSHTDPGRGYPIRAFLFLTRLYRRSIR